MPSLYLYVVSRFPEGKKIFPDHSFLKLKSGFVNQTHANYFTCTIVSISIVPWFTEAIEWSLGVITPSVFMTAIICSVALIYVWKKKKTVNLKVLVREKINIPPHCKSALSVVLEDFHKVVAWLLKQYTSTANVTRNTLFWNSLPSSFASIRKQLHIFNFGF